MDTYAVGEVVCCDSLHDAATCRISADDDLLLREIARVETGALWVHLERRIAAPKDMVNLFTGLGEGVAAKVREEIGKYMHEDSHSDDATILSLATY